MLTNAIARNHACAVLYYSVHIYLVNFEQLASSHALMHIPTCACVHVHLRTQVYVRRERLYNVICVICYIDVVITSS